MFSRAEGLRILGPFTKELLDGSHDKSTSWSEFACDVSTMLACHCCGISKCHILAHPQQGMQWDAAVLDNHG